MPTYQQGERPLSITTPLDKDALLLVGVHGSESISQLFNFKLDLLAPLGTKIQFDRIIGQKATVELQSPSGDKRYFDGLIKRLTQGRRDDTFVYFHAELVPKLWLLTKKVRSRIFQQLPVPEILKHVFSGLEVSYKLSATYYDRDYCAQYRESDFDFASRLMEEEGIYYFFDHTHNGHQLVVSDAAAQHPAVSGPASVIYDEIGGGAREELRVYSWQKSQELRSGEYTLWDHCFELPGKNLEAKEKTIGSVAVGKVEHKLHVGGNDQLEIYDYPGGYAQRFDGVGRSGANQPQNLQDIFRDKDRTVRVRMEQEEVSSIEINAASNCAYFAPGHRFALERHFDADGAYLLTRVGHEAQMSGGYRSGKELTFHYENHFDAIPLALSYRPQRTTLRPQITGIETATVVGPKGEEIFLDKYGRVKVQFHWDREGKMNGDSSCWVRVAQAWAGKGWGTFFWPRIGHEVVVAFEDGDPDQPLIIGSVYNAENMPWYQLPANKMLAGFKSESFTGTPGKNYNAIVFNDHKGMEHISMHSERNVSFNSENSKMIHSGRHKGERVAVASVLTVGKLIPGGGGSGGGDFDEGNAVPSPPPTGIVGINSVVTYGANLQGALPLNHQVALGNNLQICVNPAGLLAGLGGVPLPGAVQAFMGSGMGGNMQFTIGANAQFTWGQSFEISVGPPKIEIHQGYDGHTAVNVLCAVLGAAVIAFFITYDIMAHQDVINPGSTFVDPNAPVQTVGEQQADKTIENPGDRARAVLFLAYQLLVSGLLVAIMGAESIYDGKDWFAGDTIKKLFNTFSGYNLWKPDEKKPDGVSWPGGVAFAAGAAATLAILAEEVAGTT